MKKVVFILIIFVFTAGSFIWACEPCHQSLNLSDTIDQSDLIIIGEIVAVDPSSDTPDWIDIKIEEVIKGQEKASHIRVNSWTGMCPYGIIVYEGEFVIFLVNSRDENKNYQYDAVNHGCSVKTYPIEL